MGCVLGIILGKCVPTSVLGFGIVFVTYFVVKLTSERIFDT